MSCRQLATDDDDDAGMLMILMQVAVNGADTDLLQDTVGAVCVDDGGNVASAVSSGGIILKQPGRLGQVCTVSVSK